MVPADNLVAAQATRSSPGDGRVLRADQIEL